MKTTVTWAWLGDHAVVVYLGGRPSDDDFEVWLRAYAEMAPRLRGLLVYTRGAGPDAAQRSRIMAVMQDKAVSHATAIVSDSLIMRSITAAFNWFLPASGKPGVAFAPGQLERALDHLQLTKAERAQLRSALMELLPERDHASIRPHP